MVFQRGDWLLERITTIFISFLIGVCFLFLDIDYGFIQELGISPYWIRIILKFIGFISMIVFGLILIWEGIQKIKQFYTVD